MAFLGLLVDCTPFSACLEGFVVQEYSSDYGWVPKRSNGAGCKPVGSAFGGSNPSPPTSRFEKNTARAQECLAHDLKLFTPRKSEGELKVFFQVFAEYSVQQHLSRNSLHLCVERLDVSL